MLIYNLELKPFSRELRKNMTDTERLLWSKIRMKQLEGYRFQRQRIIGEYIVDFYCPKARLVIEVDGGPHYSDEMVKKDKIRDEYLKNHGLKVLRYNDAEVLKNINGVIEDILSYLEPLSL